MAVTDSALSLLGLALRGNNLAVGEEPVAEACKTRRAKLVITASDASLNTVERAQRWAQNVDARPLFVPWDTETLGRALGRSTCAMAALTDQGLAAALLWKLADRDPAYRELAEDLAEQFPRPPKPMKKKKPRAETIKPVFREI